MKSIPAINNNHPLCIYSTFFLLNHSHMHCPPAWWASRLLSGHTVSKRQSQVQDQWPSTNNWCGSRKPPHILWGTRWGVSQQSDDCLSHLFSAMSFTAHRLSSGTTTENEFSKLIEATVWEKPTQQASFQSFLLSRCLFVVLCFNPCPSLSYSILCPFSSWRHLTLTLREVEITYKHRLISPHSCPVR